MQEFRTFLEIRSSLNAIKADCLRHKKFQSATVKLIPLKKNFLNNLLYSPTLALTTLGRFMLLSAILMKTSVDPLHFTSLHTLTVHLEIIKSMDPSSRAMVVEMFVLRLGTSSMIWSVYGTNFI